jgi:hypothetical protein
MKRYVGGFDVRKDIVYSWPSENAMREAKKTRDPSQRMSHTFAEALDLELIHPLVVYDLILANEETGMKIPLSIKEAVEKKLEGLSE